jgi:hypothetical protein
MLMCPIMVIWRLVPSDPTELRSLLPARGDWQGAHSRGQAAVAVCQHTGTSSLASSYLGGRGLPRLCHCSLRRRGSCAQAALSCP